MAKQNVDFFFRMYLKQQPNWSKNIGGFWGWWFLEIASSPWIFFRKKTVASNRSMPGHCTLHRWRCQFFWTKSVEDFFMFPLKEGNYGLGWVHHPPRMRVTTKITTCLVTWNPQRLSFATVTGLGGGPIYGTSNGGGFINSKTKIGWIFPQHWTGKWCNLICPCICVQKSGKKNRQLDGFFNGDDGKLVDGHTSCLSFGESYETASKLHIQSHNFRMVYHLFAEISSNNTKPWNVPLTQNKCIWLHQKLFEYQKSNKKIRALNWRCLRFPSSKNCLLVLVKMCFSCFTHGFLLSCSTPRTN